MTEKTDQIEFVQSIAPEKVPKDKYLCVHDLLASNILTEKEKPKLKKWIANALSPKVKACGYWVPGSGLDKAIILVDKQVLFDEEQLLLWLTEYRDLRDFILEFYASEPEVLKKYRERKKGHGKHCQIIKSMLEQL